MYEVFMNEAEWLMIDLKHAEIINNLLNKR